MKNLLPISILGIFLLSLFHQSCGKQSGLPDFDSDTINIMAALKPNEQWYMGRHTYGTDSIIGNTMLYRMASDSARVFVETKITLLELHPRITANLMGFIHTELINNFFINEGDTIFPFGTRDLTEKGFSQQYIAQKILDWQGDKFYKELPTIMTYRTGYNLVIEMEPVFLNEDFVTYHKYAYNYTGGMHGNYTSFLQTYNRKTGETLDLEDIIIPEKIDLLRERVALHMAKKYPIYSTVSSVESYLDSMNRWKGLTDWGVIMGVTKAEDRGFITLKNYPLNDPGIHGAGLVFTYEMYHLTPGCDGCPTVLITFDEIRDCLKEPFCNYQTEMVGFEKYNDNDDLYIDKVQWYTEEQLDSARKASSPADDGHPWPRDISDWYRYRVGDITHQYSLNDLVGTWIGYGHLYDPRQYLTLNKNGSFVSVGEEALTKDSNGQMIYNYTNTIRGRYRFDSQKNLLMLRNWENMELKEETLEAYIKQKDPENKYWIIHSIDRDTMYMADDSGDLWPFFRQK